MKKPFLIVDLLLHQISSIPKASTRKTIDFGFCSTTRWPWSNFILSDLLEQSIEISLEFFFGCSYYPRYACFFQSQLIFILSLSWYRFSDCWEDFRDWIRCIEQFGRWIFRYTFSNTASLILILRQGNLLCFLCDVCLALLCQESFSCYHHFVALFRKRLPSYWYKSLFHHCFLCSQWLERQQAPNSLLGKPLKNGFNSHYVVTNKFGDSLSKSAASGGEVLFDEIVWTGC